MTVGSQVKSCFSSLKSIEASLETLALQSNEIEASEAFKKAQAIMKEIKQDLDQQVIFLSQEEPQYKQ
ncbi:DUF1657 domain-containing protein [Ornithinibacillus sp. L9]|uniref:DUF1657 domain-containing protein n=1 Tax=Ornithinibacillus caprae TaxID=2678566 RepID=A0A6N8FKS8_9BACI|nr:DUF1657 domain-containing protein [Ornithinibacillus caprae]MUK90260.1 DUF1657 domain-containing protein [Ornithinibacillus caprae]